MTINDLRGGYKVVGSAPLALPIPQQIPDSSTLGHTATFPAAPHDTIPAIAAKTVGNLPSSTINFGKNIVDFLNPLNAAKNVAGLASGLQDNIDNPVSAPSIGAVAKEVPGQLYHAVVPQFLQHIFAGDLGKAAQAIENDPVGQIAPLIFLARQGAEAAGKQAEFDHVISQAASPATKPIAAAADAARSIAGGAARFVGGQLTGISPQTIEKVISNPQQFSEQAQSSVTRPAVADAISKAIGDRQTELSGTGKEYGGIRTSTEPVPVNPTYLDTLLSEKAGLSVKNGVLKASGASDVRAPSDISALQNKLYNVWKPEFEKGYLTPEEFLNFREDLSKMAYNDSGIGKSTTLATLAERLRGQVNTDLRPSVPGLEQLDKTFAPQQTELKALTRGLVDKEGNLTDAAINRIANATGKGKDPLLTRLEKLSPGITDRIKMLKAVEDLQNSRENKTGTYTRAGTLVAGAVTFNPYLLVAAVLSLPELAVPILRGVGYSADTISGVLKTLGIKAAPAVSAAKSAATAAALAVPTVQNKPKP